MLRAPSSWSSWRRFTPPAGSRRAVVTAQASLSPQTEPHRLAPAVRRGRKVLFGTKEKTAVSMEAGSTSA